MTTSAAPKPHAPPASPGQAWWRPRIWRGCSLGSLWRILADNHFVVSPRYWPELVLSAANAALNSVLGIAEQRRFGRRLAHVEIRDPPLFIIGHWRTGTTLLHELLALDERHVCPTHYQCLVPHHCLMTEMIVRRWMGFLLPPRRPMDGMALSWDRPQEDEFALCLLGAPSPYRMMAFPNHPPEPGSYDIESLDPARVELWKQTFITFLKHLSFLQPRRLVLKSPTHTMRIPLLLELFPQARFVHIVRQPCVVFPSTMHLWRSLFRTQALQVARTEGLEEFVLRTFERMDARYEATRGLIPTGQLWEMRYEDLVADPRGQLRILYERLGLGAFERVLPRIEGYLAEHAGYETNRYTLAPEWRQQVAERWGGYARRYGYADEAAVGPAEAPAAPHQPLANVPTR
jgi:hypothetical protein